MEDLASYKVKVLPALEGTYRGKKVYTSHAPTSGPVLLHMLNLLERFDLSGEGRTGLNTHRMVEALKCMYIFLSLGQLAHVCFFQSALLQGKSKRSGSTA